MSAALVALVVLFLHQKVLERMDGFIDYESINLEDVLPVEWKDKPIDWSNGP